MIWILLMVLGICFSLEGMVRLGITRGWIDPQFSVGSAHDEFELKLLLLDQLAQENDLECVFIGSSQIKRSVLPEIFSQAYKEATGKPINCFNFGIPGAGANSQRMLVDFIAHKYQPSLIILESSVHGLSDKWRDSTREAIANNPWLLYKTGYFNLEGWLIDQSYALRFYLVYRNWMVPDFRGLLAARETLMANLSPSGYHFQNLSLDLDDIGIAPGLETNTPFDERLFANLENFEISQEKLDLLGTIVNLERGLNFIVVEPPVHSTFSYYYEDYSDYIVAQTTLGNYFEGLGVPFWRASEFPIIPDHGWRDRNHMNVIGALLYSSAMGERVGEAVNTGVIPDPTK